MTIKATLPLTLTLIDPTGRDPRLAPERAAALRAELTDLAGVQLLATPTTGALEPATKGGEALTLGVLALAVAPTVIPAFTELLGHWLQRNSRARIRVQSGQDVIEIDGLDVADPAALEVIVARLREQLAGGPAR